MSLARYDYNYNQGLVWAAQTSGTPLYKQKNIPPDRAQAEIDKDIPRTKLYPKNKYSQDTSYRFYSGWNNIQKPFCFIQGDMDGGAFIKYFWIKVALDSDLTLLDGNLNDDLRFGYVSDNNRRCSLVLSYNKENPAKWMACVIKDSEKVSFARRKATLFISDYFRKQLKHSNVEKKIPEKIAAQEIAATLGSRLLAQEMRTFFDADGRVNISRVEEFEQKELQSVGCNYVIDSNNKPLSAPYSRHYLFDTVGAGVGGGAGWWLGVFLVGPMFAVPTLGLSLVFAPIVTVIVGAIVGMLMGVGLSLLMASAKPTSPPPKPVPSSAPLMKMSHTSHHRMAKSGIRADVKPVESDEVELSSPSMKTFSDSLSSHSDLDSSPLSCQQDVPQLGCSSSPSST